MSLGDEQELRQRLGAALDTITPPLAPVDAVVRKGRAIRTRRRIGVMAGLAAAVAIGVAGPSLAHELARPPVSPAKPRITVRPVGPHATDGVIGAGAINGKSWRITALKPGTAGAGPGEQCFAAAGAAGNEQDCGTAAPFTGGRTDPVAFAGPSGNHVQLLYGAVAREVTRVSVVLADGTVLVMHPTEAYGQRYIGFAIPADLVISTITAYSGHAELSYAVPFHAGEGSSVNLWLRPGQRALPRASYRVGSGTVDGKAWSETVHAGPWGYCLSGSMAGCLGAQSPSPANIVNVITGTGPRGPNWIMGTASPAVAHVVAALSDGSTVKVSPVDAGGPRFFALGFPDGQKLVRVIYYAASGRQLASQSAQQILG